MRFGIVHRILLDSLIALGLLALVATGEFGRLGSWVLVLALALALLLPNRWQERRGLRLFASYAPLVLMAVQLLRWIDGDNPLTIAVQFAAILQIIRVATRRGAAHDQQLIALSLLHLIAATVLGGGLSFAICFVGFILVTPSALVLSHLRREVEGNYRQGARDRTGLPVDVPRILRSRRVISRGYVAFISMLSLPVFLVTALIFVTFPRVGLSLLLLEPHRSSRMVGFSDRIDLGGLGGLQTNPAIAMRLTYPNSGDSPPRRISVYLRGAALDRYEGRAWSRTKSERRYLDHIGTQYAIARFPDPARDPTVTVELEPIDPPLLFVPERTVALELLPHSNQVFVEAPTIYQGTESDLHYARLDDRRGPRYRVYLDGAETASREQLGNEERARYLQLDSSVTEPLRDLARQWANGSTNPQEIATRIEAKLRSQYRYDLNSPSGKTRNPLEDFLLVSKRGHCEFYSTAMALLLRTRGIPSRNVTGFAGATYNRFGKFYAVRQGDAHSWVEAWINGIGWKRFDPTPSSSSAPLGAYERWGNGLREVIEAVSQRWSRHVERYDLRQQLELLGGAKRRAEHASKLALPPIAAKQLVGYLVLAGLVFGGIRHFAQARRGRKKQDPATSVDQSVEDVIRLYKQLEQLMASRGVARHASVPPLAHARALQAMGHPFACEILELTEIYLAARFGGARFGFEELSAFDEVLTTLRRTTPSEWKRTPQQSAPNPMIPQQPPPDLGVGG